MIDQTWVNDELTRGHYSLLRARVAQSGATSNQIVREELLQFALAVVAQCQAEKHHLNARFHIEGGKLVKTSNGQPVPPEEPTFILRGRDLLAMPTLATYYKLGEQDGCNEEFLAGIREAMNGFARFEFEQRAKMKQPGITRGL